MPVRAASALSCPAAPLLAALLLVVAWAAAAGAGPWPRDAGSWFVSTSLGLEDSPQGRRLVAQAYVEWGVTPQLTAVMKLRRDGDRVSRSDLLAIGLRDGTDRLDVALRWHPLQRPGEGGGVRPVGLDLGLGLRHGIAPGALAERYRATLHLGHGGTLAGRPGWLRASLGVKGIAGQDRPDGELFLQAGWRPAPTLLAMLSASHYRSPQSHTTKLMPAVGLRLDETLTAVLEASHTLAGPRERALHLGLWRDF